MSEPHAHSHSPRHVHHGQHAGTGPALPVAAQRASWLLRSAAQRLLGIALIGLALVAAMLWATSTQG